MSRRENTHTLAAATACGNWVVVRDLLCDEDVDLANVERCLVLHKLASTPNIAFALAEDIVDEILSCNQNINMTDNNGDTAVMAAARCENWKVVWLLISRQLVPPDKDSVISFLRIVGRSEYMNKNCGLSVNILSCLWDNIKKTIPECLRRDIHDVLIHVAAKLNCWQFLRDLITSDSGLNTLDEDGLGLVHRLAKGGMNHHIFILHKVLENGGDINLRNVDGDTATHVAVKNNNWGMVLALVRRGARVDTVNNDNYTVLHMLAQSSPSNAEEAIDTIFSFLQKCCQNTDVREKGGNTALHLAVKERNYVVAEKLLILGARADVQDGNGRTVLHTMATHKQEYSSSLLKKVIECGAGLEIKDSEGNTALHLAAKLGNWEYVNDLIAHGAVVTEADSDGCTVYARIFTKETSPVCLDVSSLEILPLNVQLYLAVKLERWKAVEDLVKKGADVNQPDCFGFTVLHRLVQLEIEKYVDSLFGFLVNRGADITVQTPAGDSLLQLAAKHKNWFVVKRLLQGKQRFNVYEPDSEGFCVVHRLAEYREKGISALFRLFDNKDAVTSAQTQDKDTLLQLAARHGNIPMVEYLVQLNRAVEISQLDSVGLSVIHHIVRCDSTETTEDKLVSLVKLLIKKGADPHFHSSAGDTALHLAAKHNKWDIVSRLLKLRYDLNEPDSEGFCILHRLAQATQTTPVLYRSKQPLFQILLNKGADVTIRCSTGDTALHLAAKHNNWTLVKHFVMKRCDINQHDSEGFCILHRLAQANRMTSVSYRLKQKSFDTIHKTLLSKGADVSIRCSTGDTALHLAAKHENWTLVEHLVEEGCDINQFDSEGFCILHRLAQATQTTPESYRSKQKSFDTIYKTLLSKGADVSIRCSTGDTALHLAAKHENWTLVEHLVEEGCDINQSDSEGFCILHRLAQASQTTLVMCSLKRTFFDDLLQTLLSKGADVSIRCSTGDTALHLAAKHKNWSLVEHLIEEGCDINQPDSEGFYSLHRFAQQKGAYPSYKLSETLLDPFFKKLLDKGACPFVRNQSGDTVLHVAVKSKDWPIAEHLVELGANINEPDSEGFSILHRIVEQGYSHLLEQFVMKGADLNWNCPNIGTVLHMAVKTKDWSLAKRLVEMGADVNADLDGLNILHLIAQNIGYVDDDCIELFHLFVSKGVDLTARSCRGDSVFHLAARNDNWEIISHRIDGIERVEEPDSEGYTILHRLAISGNAISLLQFLLDNGAKCDTLCPSGDSAMHLAVNHNNWYILEELLRNEIEPESISPATSKQCININNFQKNGDKEKTQDSKRVRNRTGRAPFNIDARDSCGNTVLHLSAKIGNWNQVHTLLTCGADASLKDGEGHTVLYWLAVAKNVWGQSITPVIEILRKTALDTWERDEFGDILIQVAARNKNAEVVDLLIDHLDDVYMQDKDGLTILHRVVQCTSPVSLKIVKTLIKRKVDLEIPGPKGDTAIHLAAHCDNWNVVYELLDHVLDVNSTNSKGLTILHRAAKCTQSVSLKLLEILLKRQADTEIPSPKGDTALHLAAQCGNWDLVRELIENGANINNTDSQGMSVLHRLVRPCKFPLQPTSKEIHLSLLRSLVSNGININTKDRNDVTAVHLALADRDWKCSQVLLESGANVDHTVLSKRKYFLHELAFDTKVDVETARSVTVQLGARGFFLNERDTEGNTPLNLAARCRNWSALYVFLEQGADASLPDSEGWFVCHWLAKLFEHWNLSGISLSSLLLLLTRDGLQVNQTGPDGKSCVQLSIEMNKWDLFWWLVEHRLTYCLTLKEKKTILEHIFMLKTDDTDQNKLKTLILCVTETDGFSCSELAQCVQKALKMSILKCNWDVAKALVDCGADIRINEDDKPLMHLLISKYRRSDHEKWLSFLDTVLTHGADINSRNREGRTILFQNWKTFSFRFGKYASDSLLQALLDRGASPLIADINGKSLLRYALNLEEGLALKSVSVLIELGVSTHQPALTETANTNSQHLSIAGGGQSSTRASLSSASPTQRAFEKKFVEAFEMLVESGASSNRELFELSTRYQVELSSRDMTGAERQMLDILNHAASQPRSLKSLCRLTVSHALGCGPRRMERVKSLPLPLLPSLQDYVVFRDVLSRELLTCQETKFIFFSFLSTYLELVDEDFDSGISFESYDEYEDFLEE